MYGAYNKPPMQDGDIPFSISTNFSSSGYNYSSAGIYGNGEFYGKSFITYPENTSDIILQSRDVSVVSPFTILANGEIVWTYGLFSTASLRMSTTTNNRLVVEGNLFINTNFLITSPSTYTNSVGSVRDVFITSAGTLGVNLSSEKYKEDIVNITIDPQKVYQIQPVEFKYKEGHINEEAKDQKFIGLIAEQLNQIGLNQFVEYDENGDPDSVKYSMLSLALIEAVKDLNNRLSQLENN